jgi:hypothetical protein
MKWLVSALIVLITVGVSAQELLPTTKPIKNAESTATERPQVVSQDSLTQFTPFRVTLLTKPNLSILTIDVLPNKGAEAEVYLINSAGEKVRSYLKGPLKTGKTDFAVETKSLPAGLYYIVSIIEGRQYAEKITVGK